MSLSLHIALAQFDIAWEQPMENIRRVEQLLQKGPSPDLLVLPEMWSTGFSMRPEQAAESFDGPAVQWMKSHAAQTGTIVCGSVSTRDGNHFVNRFYTWMPDGQFVIYDKKHLFSYGREDQHYTPGYARVTFKVKDWTIMPVICYDLRFPAWCRNTIDYDLLLVVANWPEARIHHWDALLHARAIENQAYVAAVNRIGTDGNQLQYSGHSSIYDMTGMMMDKQVNSSCLIHRRLDRDALMQYRDQFPFLQDRDSLPF